MNQRANSGGAGERTFDLTSHPLIMEPKTSKQRAACTDLSLDQTFKHPQGLSIARSLVRHLYVARKMQNQQNKSLPGLQNSLTNTFHVSRPVPTSAPTMPDALQQVLTFNESNTKPKKRRLAIAEGSEKRQKLDIPAKTKRIAKTKVEKKEAAKFQLDDHIWMRILEFTPPSFLGKARLLCRELRDMVDKYTSIYSNCRKENYGNDMPPPPLGLTERQYSNLLGSKGCLEPGCEDKGASRTHWSWAKRWCAKCWRSKIEREDRVIKNRGDRIGNRATFQRLLECIPVGMHDSFMKPHDYVDIDNNRSRAAPRLYKYYLKEEVEKIIQTYEDLSPKPHLQDPNKTVEENAAALALYTEEMSKLEEKRNNFFATEKAKIDEHMVQVQKIEAGVRERREKLRNPYDKNRSSRKELFTRRAREDLPHIDEDFVKNTVAFKAATRVFRDGGTERGWKTLKPKIEKEWLERDTIQPQENLSSNLPQMDVAASDLSGLDRESPDTMEPEEMNIDSRPASVPRDDIIEPRRPANFIDPYGMAANPPLPSVSYQQALFLRQSSLHRPAHSQQNGSTGMFGFGDDDFDNFVGLSNTSTRHNEGSFSVLRSAHDLDIQQNSLTPQWTSNMRALPPPPHIVSNASLSHGSFSHTTALSSMSSTRPFAGIMLPSVSPSENGSRSSNMAISSLVHPQ